MWVEIDVNPSAFPLSASLLLPCQTHRPALLWVGGNSPMLFLSIKPALIHHNQKPIRPVILCNFVFWQNKPTKFLPFWVSYCSRWQWTRLFNEVCSIFNVRSNAANKEKNQWNRKNGVWVVVGEVLVLDRISQKGLRTCRLWAESSVGGSAGQCTEDWLLQLGWSGVYWR